MNIQKILVPIDFSEMSIEGLKAAQHLAKTWNAQVTPLHAYGPGQSQQHDEQGPIDQDLISNLNDFAEKHIDKNHLSAGLICANKPVQAINDAASDYDLVVMSTHGRTGFTRLILGSVTEKVIRTCPIPVIAVENASNISNGKPILVTTDFSEHSKRIFPYVQAFAQKTNSEVHLIYIVSYEQYQQMTELHGTQSKYNRRLKELVNEHLPEIADLVTVEVVLSNSSIHEEITRLSENRPFSMVMMATLGWTGLDYLRLGSTASNVVRHVEMPVFTLNPKTQ